MSKAISDPDEIRKFAHLLREAANNLRDKSASLKSSFNNLHDHWQDEKYERFRELFTQTVLYLERFNQQIEDYVRHLHKKAEALDEYLRHRY